VGANPLTNTDRLGLDFFSDVSDNFRDLNSSIAGNASRSFAAILAVGALAEATTSITPLQFALSGFRGATMGAASFAALETGLTAAMLGITNTAFSGLSFEAGAVIGSAINAIPLSCDSPFRNFGNRTVRDVVSGIIENAIERQNVGILSGLRR